MPYLPLPNFNHDSGPRRIQSGPDHEGYVVLYSGVESTGADDGFAVLGAPLSGTLALGAWDYDSNWRYVPSTLPSQSGSLNPTPYNVSGALDTYDATRIYTRDTVAGAQAASAIGPETGKVNPRGGALQARSDVTRPETYMYFGGAAPDNQDYSPYNTPDANSAAEGKTGGGVTHRSFESSLLTNVLGSQGTSDRSQWRYHQPVYCKTYTETRRSESPGLMSTPLRYVYRGSASSYNYNYGSELLANKGGFELLPYDDEVLGCSFPVGCPTNSGSSDQLIVGDTLSAVVYCPFVKIEWFNSNNTLLGTGLTYTVTSADIDYRIYFKVTYPDGSTDSSSTNCFPAVIADSFRYWFRFGFSSTIDKTFFGVIDTDGGLLLTTSFNQSGLNRPVLCKISNDVSKLWAFTYLANNSPFVTVVINAAGYGYDVLDINSSSVEFILLASHTSGGLPIFPFRFYKVTVNKSTGSVSNTVAVDFTPPGSPSASNVNIRDVFVDNDNNYYFVGFLPINSETWSPHIVKFDSNFQYQWSLLSQAVRYRSGSLCTLKTNEGQLYISGIDNNQIIGSAWRGDSFFVYSNFFAINFDGTVATLFKTKFSTPDFSTDINPFLVRSVCRDLEGNVYGIGGYEDSVALGRFGSFIVYKDSPSDITLWATDIRNTFYSAGRPTVNVEERQLLYIDSKLVLVLPWEYVISSVSRHRPAICVFDPDTGTMLNAIEIHAPIEFEGSMCIQRMPENTKFLIQSGNGFRLRLDVNDLPTPGSSYPIESSSTFYTVSGITPNQSSATFYKFNSCSPPGFLSRNLSSYFSSVVSPSVVASGTTNDQFGYFGGQDTP